MPESVAVRTRVLNDKQRSEFDVYSTTHLRLKQENVIERQVRHAFVVVRGGLLFELYVNARQQLFDVHAVYELHGDDWSHATRIASIHEGDLWIEEATTIVVGADIEVKSDLPLLEKNIWHVVSIEVSFR